MKQFFALVLTLAILSSFATNNFWSNTNANKLVIKGEQKIIPQQTNLVKLDDVAFRNILLSVPSEISGNFIVITLPTPDGTFKEFKVFERATMEQALANKYPMIKTYQAICIDNPAIIAKLDYTPFGFHAMVFDNDKTYFIDPYTNVNTGFYNCYYKKGYTRSNLNREACATVGKSDEINDDNNNDNNRIAPSNNGITDLASTGLKRTFRLALACTIEYSAAVGGPTPTKTSVLAAIVTSINRVNGVYEKELSIHMNLVANNDTLIFISSDSYINNDGYTMLDQNQIIVDNRIGNANYDIGHVFSTGGGGVAQLGVICKTGLKAQGVTGLNNPVGDSYDIDYVAHEMGHQFGANHTFNAGSGGCSGNRNSSTAYEPGSGTTIMAYAGICNNNNPQQHSNDYFHRASLNEIYTYITSTSCAVTSTAGNAPPIVTDYLATYNIPYKTSFEIEAQATDPNGHPLKYCWEEWDKGPSGNWNATNNTTAPIFRSFLPSLSSIRTFPTYDSLIKNSIKYLGEVLPETTRDTKFRCTVRNINTDGYGAFNAPEVNLTVKSTVTTDLFRVTSFPSATTITGNTTQTINWNVASTTDAPISTPTVNIYLSLDSARTFPYLLASNTLNDGSETVTIPDVFTNNASARIKVKGKGNIFFDLNDGWIKINKGIPPVVASFTVNDSIICEGMMLTFTNTSTGNPDSVRWSIIGGTPTTSNSATTVNSTFNNSGFYTVSLIAFKNGIASATFSTSIQVKPKSTSSITKTICQGESIIVGGQTFTTTQVNKQIVLLNGNSLGCDSTITLNLVVNPKSTSSITQTICNGESITIGGQTFTTTQVNKQIVLSNGNSLGCDSTITLNLVVNPKSTSTITSSICNGESITVGGQTFTTTQVNKQIVLSNGNSLGCDSTITLNLVVNPKSTSTITTSICDGQSITVGGQTFTTTQVNKQIVLSNGNSLGCDSTITLNLVVNPKSTSTITTSICNGQSITIGGQTFSTAQVNKQIVLANGNNLGCDSTITLNLAIETITTPSILQSSDTLYCNSVATGANYVWYKNGSIIATTSIPQYVITSSGNYTVKIISVNNCESDLSNIHVVSIPSSIKTNSLNISYSILPNPNNGQFDIKIISTKNDKYTIFIYNAAGQELVKDEMNIQQGTNTKHFNFDNIEKGMYFISLTGKDGVTTQNIMVQ